MLKKTADAYLVCTVAMAISIFSLEVSGQQNSDSDDASITKKTHRQRISDLPTDKQEFFRSTLAERKKHLSDKNSDVNCKNITVFCRQSVDEGYMDFLSNYPKRVKREPGGMRVNLINLQRSKFDQFKLIGYLPEGVGPPPWSWVSRLFDAGNGNSVFLSEWDFVADDGGVELLEEYLNSKVGGFDAVAMLNVSDKGRLLWHLTWFEPRKKIDLYYSCASAPCVSQAKIFELANSLYGGRVGEVDSQLDKNRK